MSKACRQKNVSLVNHNFFNYFEHNIISLVSCTKSSFNIRTRTDIRQCDFSIWWVVLKSLRLMKKKRIHNFYITINKLTNKYMCRINGIKF